MSATLKLIAFWESTIFQLTSNLVEVCAFIYPKDGADLIRDEEVWIFPRRKTPATK
jgi:hypothetical protein